MHAVHHTQWLVRPWIMNNISLNAKNIGEKLHSNHLMWCASCHHLTAFECHEVMGKPRRMIDIVQHHDDRTPLLTVQSLKQLQYLDLMCHIKIRRWFIKQNQLGI